MSTPIPVKLSTQLGDLKADFPGSAARLAWPVLLGALAAYGLIASLVQWSGEGLLFWLVVGGACLAYYWVFQRALHAQIYDQGFVITRGGKTTAVRWNDVAKVEHWLRKRQMFGVITTSTTHSFTIYLRNGERVKVTPALRDSTRLGSIIEQMWAHSMAARQRAQEA